MKRNTATLTIILVLTVSCTGGLHFTGEKNITFTEMTRASHSRELHDLYPLSETVETSHFVIHYKWGHEIFVHRVADLAEGVYEDATSFYQCAPEEKVHIYMYPSTSFPSYTGYTVSSSAFVITYGCPFSTQSMGLNYDDEKGIIAHEFNHILFEKRMEMSGSVLRDCHQWLSEGIATYYAKYPNVRDEDVASVVEYLEENDDFPAALEEITVSRYERLVYPLSYSIIAFITETYGDEKVSLFLDHLEEWDPLSTSDANVERAMQTTFGKTKEEFEKEWVSCVKGLSNRTKEKPEHGIVQKTYLPGWRVVSSWYGDSMLIVSPSGEGNDIYLMDEDGNMQLLIGSLPSEFDPKFSPDGKRIAFTSLSVGYSGYFYSISVMDADGRHVNQLTFGSAVDVMGSWSPDGTKIAFTSTRSGNYDVYLMNADGSGVTQLTSYEGEDGWPSFSPEGKIVFVSDRGGNYDLYIMNADGTEVEQLTDTPEWENYPVFSPDGKRIAFLSRGEDGVEVCVMARDGGERETVAGIPDFIVDRNAMLDLMGCPVWSPDGRTIAFTAVSQIFTVSVGYNRFWFVAVIIIVMMCGTSFFFYVRKRKVSGE